MLWNIGKRKRKGFSEVISVLAQQPSTSLPAQPQPAVPTCPLARGRSPLPRFPPGLSPASRLARKQARAFLSLSPSLTSQARLSGSPPSSSHRRRRFPSLPTLNPAPNLPLSLLGAPSGYISKGAAPLRIHPALLKLLWCSRDRSLRAGVLAATSPSHVSSLVHPRLRFGHRWARRVLLFLLVLPVCRLVVGEAVSSSSDKLGPIPAIAPPSDHCSRPAFFFFSLLIRSDPFKSDPTAEDQRYRFGRHFC
jgi:hypothetical protein